MHQHAAQSLRQDDRRSLGSVFPLDAPRGELTWRADLGVGFYPVEAGITPYDQAYFDRFERDANTPLGRALMDARCDFVACHYQGVLLDVGIGSGAFIDRRRADGRSTYGYDVNPAGIRWLKDRHLDLDPYVTSVPAASFWDVLEHIPFYGVLLANVRRWVFLSLPIFHDKQHALRSKHFRPTEHCWYFSRDGLVLAMNLCGFELAAENVVETELGREDIGSFAFRRAPE